MWVVTRRKALQVADRLLIGVNTTSVWHSASEGCSVSHEAIAAAESSSRKAMIYSTNSSGRCWRPTVFGAIRRQVKCDNTSSETTRRPGSSHQTHIRRLTGRSIVCKSGTDPCSRLSTARVSILGGLWRPGRDMIFDLIVDK